MDSHHKRPRWAGVFSTFVILGVILIVLLFKIPMSDERGDNYLDSLPKGVIHIDDKSFHVWIACRDPERERGLMFVSQDELTPERDGSWRGMLFLFDDERQRGFWMKNVPIPLDIAFARADGTIVAIRTMTPLSTRSYSSVEPARFALEVRAGLFAELGIGIGMRLLIPSEVLNSCVGDADTPE